MTDIFQIIVQSNTLNFLIVLAVIIFAVYFLKIGEKTENIRDEIKNYVQSSISEKTDAQNELDKINDKISKLPERTEEIRQSAQNSMKGISEKIQNEINAQKKDFDNNAERIFNLETKKFKSTLNKILSEKSIELAVENAKAQLNSDKKLHNIYIDKAIEELDGISL